MLGESSGWQLFTVRPEPLTREEKKAYLATVTDVALGSDAFFPFGDNIERAHRSGVTCIAQPGGSIRITWSFRRAMRTAWRWPLRASACSTIDESTRNHLKSRQV